MCPDVTCYTCSSRKDAIRKDAIRKDTIRKDTIRKDAIRKDAINRVFTKICSDYLGTWYKSRCKNRAYEIYRSKLRSGAALTIQLHIASKPQLIER